MFTKLTLPCIVACLIVVLSTQPIYANFDISKDSTPVATPAKKWYDQISLRGYGQVRYNRLLETNSKLKCDQCDRSWGDGGGFFLRRMRLIFSGNIHERVYLYFQPDFASSASSTALHFGQIRDMYFDIALDEKKEYRVRLGQSKIPFGFENMQSSQNRLPLDRNDALNSPLSNERDLGAFFYWAPEKTRKLFASLVSDGLKGSGDYGVFAFGAFNGQTANKPEANNTPHIVARVSYPFELKNGQIIEPGIQAYTGKYTITSDLRNVGLKGLKDWNYEDERVAASFVLYPKPFGIQAEYNIGRGPEFNPLTDSVETKSLRGGYITASYMIKKGHQIIIPFVRYQHYEGGKKFEQDARSYTVDETEIGIEWQPFKNFELVTMYTMSNRRFEDLKTKGNQQQGNLLRIQAQVNF
jgi:Phosphate-selective porin O and P